MLYPFAIWLTTIDDVTVCKILFLSFWFILIFKLVHYNLILCFKHSMADSFEIKLFLACIKGTKGSDIPSWETSMWSKSQRFISVIFLFMPFIAVNYLHVWCSVWCSAYFDTKYLFVPYLSLSAPDYFYESCCCESKYINGTGVWTVRSA